MRSPLPASSLVTISVSDPTEVPVYTPMTVSKPVPAVVKVTAPAEGAVHLNHTVVVAVLQFQSARSGSPFCGVAPTFVPVTEPDNAELPPLVLAAPEAAYSGPEGGGPAVSVVFCRSAPVAPFLPETQMK